MAHISCKFRIYPSKSQQDLLHSWQGTLRFLWNCCVEMMRNRRDKYDAFAKPKAKSFGKPGTTVAMKDRPSYESMSKMLTECRAADERLRSIPVEVSRKILKNIDSAVSAFFNKNCKHRGFPKFKRKTDWIDVGGTSSACFKLSRGSLRFSGIPGDIKLVMHREIVGAPKQCTITRDVDQWFASIMFEVQDSTTPVHQGPAVGIDRGVTWQVADSDGALVENPKFLAHSADKLARAQRDVDRKQKGSNNQKKARAKVAKIHRKIRRQREHWLGEVTAKYAKDYSLICIEDLKIQNMVKSAKGTAEEPGVNVAAKSGLNKSILDASWGAFASKLEMKAAKFGGKVVKVPPAHTSQTCASCGIVRASNRKGDTYRCECGYVQHADVNAAIEILRRGVELA